VYTLLVQIILLPLSETNFKTPYSLLPAKHSVTFFDVSSVKSTQI